MLFSFFISSSYLCSNCCLTAASPRRQGQHRADRAASISSMSLTGYSSAHDRDLQAASSSPRRRMLAHRRRHDPLVPYSVETRTPPVSATQPPTVGARATDVCPLLGLVWGLDYRRWSLLPKGDACSGPDATGPTADRSGWEGGTMQGQRLTVRQTATGYWVVRRGTMQLAGAPTRQGAEAERELLRGLRDRRVRRSLRSRPAASSRK